MTTGTTHLAKAQPTAESRNLGVLAHLSAFITFVGIPSLLGPLFVMLANRDNPYVDAQAKEAFNFNLSFTIYGIVAAISVILLIGLIALPAVLVTWFVLVIAASVQASNGVDYRYPLTIRFVS